MNKTSVRAFFYSVYLYNSNGVNICGPGIQSESSCSDVTSKRWSGNHDCVTLRKWLERP